MTLKNEQVTIINMEASIVSETKLLSSLDKMNDAANVFRQHTRDIKRKMWWQNTKVTKMCFT